MNFIGNEFISNSCCNNCDKNLFGKPKINVEGIVYCFGCAKKIEKEINKQRREIFYKDVARRKIEYDLNKEIYSKQTNEWWSKREEYVGQGRLGFITLCCIVIVIGIISEILYKGAGFFAFIFSAIISFKISSAKTKNKIADFEKNNPPPPKFTESDPQNERVKLCSHHIIGPDGVSFKSIKYREEVLRRDAFKCQNCGNGPNKLEVHHIVPIASGGSDDPTNLITLCIYCHDREDWYGHVRKNPTTLIEYVCIRSTKKYHLSYCSFINKVKPANKECFYSTKEAEQAGYKRCLACRP